MLVRYPGKKEGQLLAWVEDDEIHALVSPEIVSSRDRKRSVQLIFDLVCYVISLETSERFISYFLVSGPRRQDIF